MKKNLTMKDVAKLAGVSQPTVSRIINGTATVNPDLKEKVEKIILQYNFKPNSNAKILRGVSSKIIGVILFDLANYYYLEMIRSIEKTARDKGYTIIVLNSQGDKELEKDHILQLLARKVDGIIILPVSKKNLDFIKEQRVSFVVADNDISGYPCVSTSLFQGGRSAAEYFYNLNHKKISFIGANKKNIKLMGVKKFLEEKNIEFLEEWFIETDATNSNLHCIADSLNKMKNFPTAFITSNDIIALHLLKILEKKGLLVPRDVSILSFDDTIIASALNLTSIKYPVDQMMEKATEQLLNKVESNTTTTLDPLLIERESSCYLNKN